jgi:type II secretory ATPase GspE/PulE/Tfp pilus assembly ATPase PilB-like protein
MRVDGMLSDKHLLPVKIHAEVISRIKILSSLRTDEHQAAQDGRFRHLSTRDGPVDIRVSVMPTYHGENAVLRLLTAQNDATSLESLGFGKEERDRIEAALLASGGLILATGPTGSGKTTTLYTLLKMLHAPHRSIVTIEDPVEYAVEGVRQVQVNQRTDLTFAKGLRALLRQDPDLMMVGEIRDAETAGLAVNTALTGHLVLSTLHTTNAAAALPRLLDMKAEPYLIASTVELVIAQRLVRRICKDCKEESGDGFRGTGCEACLMTGYKGRISINEVLCVDGDIRDAIAQRKSAGSIHTLAKKAGMRTMAEDGAEKVKLGVTTAEEVLRAIHE